MLKTIRTNSEHADFIQLVRQLDAYLAEIDGEEHAFYHQFNHIDQLNQVVLVYDAEQPVACGAIKPLPDGAMEIKRMYTHPDHRGKGLGTRVLQALEQWTSELAATHCRLETGARQSDAIALYLKNGYQPIPNYGQYKGVENSRCFEKNVLGL